MTSIGVADGARTRDVLDHNQVLYQLNYSHHMRMRTGSNYTSVPATNKV